ncbi:ferritin-like domain-containing protein [Mucilaginibacter sp. RS28]|uniref:Ferritin-like domain-containing protein n=1 Tax=Mucilaginibacter straminoryzae TaxID=2932774 RepID=A0A9X1X190_9SPHI|nr:ferritin-like domain-containing protein [Mucilaginibacter straminoryzae]MCJ8208901.1 ferritin-like domain-containing protein [Mucilaginibacter straminoryzae]
MNLFDIIENISNADPEFQDRISPRRAAIKNITSFGSKVAVAALPFAFSTLFKKAYGQTATTNVNDVLNFALTAEYLESSFYNKYVPKSYVPAADKPGLQLIQMDENNHVKFLKSVLGSAAIASPTFDFSGGSGSGNGPFAAVETDYDTFLALAQAFEDTGERAYKGQATNLMGNATVLTAALNIHSVEARHASHLRRMRQLRGVAIKPWKTGTQSGITVPAAAAVYVGEDNTTQAGVNIAGIVNTNAATEAFDEPLDKTSVVNILTLFIKA